ncbi:hypothetical protein M514_10753, partial [Trichuris suis]
MSNPESSLGSSIAVVSGESLAQSESQTGETNIDIQTVNATVDRIAGNDNGAAMAVTAGSVVSSSSGTTKEFNLTMDLTKAIATLWCRQPEMVMPSPGPSMMPGLTEFASQKGMKNGDGRYSGWQSHSTFSFVRYRTLGYAEWEWNMFSSLAVGVNVNVQPPVGGAAGPQMSARFGSFWSALNMDAAGGAARTNVTATPYDDETGAMMWMASRLQRQPAHWFDEDAFLRLLLIGMLCPKADWINEDRQTYVMDPELVDGVVEYNRAMPQHAFDVQATAVPVDMYIALMTRKAQGSGLCDVDFWDKNTAVVPVRMIFEDQRLGGLERAEMGIDIPVWYRPGQELQSTPVERLFWQWLCGLPDNVSIVNGSSGLDVGQAWHNLCNHRHVGTRVMSAGAVSGLHPPSETAVHFVAHRIDLSKLADKDKWSARWARPDPSYYRPFTHLGLYKADGEANEEGAPDIVTSDGRFKVPFGVVVNTDYFKHFDVVPCLDWEHAFSYCATSDVEWTLRNSDTSLEMVEVPATRVSCIVERWWAFDVSDTGTVANPKTCGHWWTATADGANDLVDASGCTGMFLSYERDLRTNTDAKSVFTP